MNWSTNTFTLTVDSAKPSNIVIDSPVEKANKTSTFNVNWTVKDNVATSLYCNVTLDGLINNTAYIVTANGSTMNYTLRNVPQAYHHELNVTCYDGLLNFNTTGLLNFTVDSVVPNVALSYPASEEAYDVTALDFNFTATDNNMTDFTCSLTLDGVTNVSSVPAINATLKNITVMGIPSGTHSWNVTCVDNASNSNVSLTRSFTISHPVAAAAAAVASTSGGGASSSAPEARESHTFNVVDSDKPVTYSLMDKSVGVSDVTFAVISKSENVKLTVEKLKSKPADVKDEPKGEVYSYINIEKKNIENTNIAWAKIGFFVDKAWLESKNMQASDVVLGKYSAVKGWEELPTEIVTLIGDKYKFEATSQNGFSTFVVMARAGSAAAEEAATEVTEEAVPEEGAVVAGTTEEVPVAEGKSRAWLWAIVILAVVGVIALSVVAYVRRSRVKSQRNTATRQLFKRK